MALTIKRLKKLFAIYPFCTLSFLLSSHILIDWLFSNLLNRPAALTAPWFLELEIKNRRIKEILCENKGERRVALRNAEKDLSCESNAFIGLEGYSKIGGKREERRGMNRK